jgi:hypothetical protein
VLRRSPYTRVPPLLPRRNGRSRASLASPAMSAFPFLIQRSASALFFSRPAQRSLLVAARVFAESPKVTLLSRRLRSSRYLHDRSDSYRLERQLPGGPVFPLRDRAFSRRTSSRIRHGICLGLCLGISPWTCEARSRRPSSNTMPPSLIPGERVSCCAIDQYSGRRLTQLALRLSPLVFVRPFELCKAERQHFDLEWRIPGSNTKMKVQ